MKKVVNKHSLRFVAGFLGIVFIALVGVFVVKYLESSAKDAAEAPAQSTHLLPGR